VRRETLRLSLACNNHCVFCAQEGIEEREEDPGLGVRLRAVRQVADEITFIGGEPTLEDALPGAVALARGLGFAAVGIQTNGRRLAYPAYAKAVADAGLTDVHVSVHGAQPAAHDYHTGVPGSLVELLAGVAAVRALGIPVVATTVLTRSNFRVLDEIPRLLTQRGVAAWLVSVPRAAGRAEAAFDRVYPRLGLAVPFALRAMEIARRLSLPAWIQGAPLCLLGTFAVRALPGGARAFGEGCGACAARARCAGLDPLYLRRFAGDETAPLQADVAPFEDSPALRRMFVGVGELASPRLLAVEPPPAALRADLAQLGKPKRGRQEVAAGAPRQTGEALREIFPDLFEKAEDRERARSERG
jgi:hypothetical protein